MVLGWRRAFCTSIPRDEEKPESPSPKITSKFRFFSSSSSSNPSTPQFHSEPSSPTSSLRCRTRASFPTQTSKVEECKSTKKSPRFFSFSNPSSPRSKVVEEKTRLSNTIIHVHDKNKLSQKSLPILKVYNDDEPLMLPTSIPESEEENNEDNFAEFQGFFVNAASTRRNAIDVRLLPEAAVISAETYAVVLKVKAPEKVARRAPIDLVAVLDVSGKMTSEKLHMMKRAMRLIVSSLSAADRFSIVAFTTTSKRLLPLRRMTAAGRRSARRIVDAIMALDGTTASATDALKKAVKVLEDRRERNSAASIILLSDSQDYRSSYSAVTAANQKREPFVYSTRLSHIEVPVHSVDLSLSKVSAYDHALHDDSFAKSIRDLLSIVVQDLKIQLGFISGSAPAEIAAVYSHTNRPTALGSGSIRLGELYAEEERELLVELKIPSSATTGPHHVLSVKCSYKDPSTQELINCKEQAHLVSRPHAVKSAPSKRLRDLFVSTRAVAEARRLVERNELAGAHHILASARALLLQSGSGSGDEFVHGLEAELSELHLRRQNQVPPMPRRRMNVERDGFAYVGEKAEPLTPPSAWRAAEKLAKLAVMRKSLNRVSDLHGFEDARF